MLGMISAMTGSAMIGAAMICAGGADGAESVSMGVPQLSQNCRRRERERASSDCVTTQCQEGEGDPETRAHRGPHIVRRATLRAEWASGLGKSKVHLFAGRNQARCVGHWCGLFLGQ